MKIRNLNRVLVLTIGLSLALVGNAEGMGSKKDAVETYRVKQSKEMKTSTKEMKATTPKKMKSTQMESFSETQVDSSSMEIIKRNPRPDPKKPSLALEMRDLWMKVVDPHFGERMKEERSRNCKKLEVPEGSKKFIVDCVFDVVDKNPGDGICDADKNPDDGLCDVGQGSCSLRAAIQEANAREGLDYICIYTYDNIGLENHHMKLEILDEGEDEDQAATGDLDIRDDLKIVADPRAVVGGKAKMEFDPRKKKWVITRKSAYDDRIFEIHPVRVGSDNHLIEVSIENLSVTLGKSGERGGGGILNEANLKLINLGITRSRSEGAGGGILSSGPLNLENVTLMSNRTDARGGGLHLAGQGSARIISSRFSHNTAKAEGGGIGSEDNGENPIFLNEVGKNLDYNVFFDNKSKKSGGGIYTTSPLIIVDTAINYSGADINGGGIYSRGDLDLSFSNLVGNSTDENGGGIYIEGTSQVTISNTSISENTAWHGNGGGMSANGPLTLSLNNVTIFENQTGIPILSNHGVARLAGYKTHITDLGPVVPGDGSGIHLNGQVQPVDISNSIIAKNKIVRYHVTNLVWERLTNELTSFDVTKNEDISNCDDPASRLSSLGYNLTDVSNDCGFSSRANDLTGVDPNLRPASPRNQVSIIIYEINMPSLAKDAGNPAALQTFKESCFMEDQWHRPRVGVCDIGASEVQ